MKMNLIRKQGKFTEVVMSAEMDGGKEMILLAKEMRKNQKIDASINDFAEYHFTISE